MKNSSSRILLPGRRRLRTRLPIRTRRWIPRPFRARLAPVILAARCTVAPPSSSFTRTTYLVHFCSRALTKLKLLTLLLLKDRVGSQHGHIDKEFVVGGYILTIRIAGPTPQNHFDTVSEEEESPCLTVPEQRSGEPGHSSRG